MPPPTPNKPERIPATTPIATYMSTMSRSPEIVGAHRES
jgi:hypothetical protein